MSCNAKRSNAGKGGAHEIMKVEFTGFMQKYIGGTSRSHHTNASAEMHADTLGTTIIACVPPILKCKHQYSASSVLLCTALYYWLA